MTSRPFTAAPILAVLAIVLVTLGAYVGGYFWLGKATGGILPPRTDFVDRNYGHAWMVPLYMPAGWLEAKLTQQKVFLDSPNTIQPALEFFL
jgi:hypothetical protein